MPMRTRTRTSDDSPPHPGFPGLIRLMQARGRPCQALPTSWSGIGKDRSGLPNSTPIAWAASIHELDTFTTIPLQRPRVSRNGTPTGLPQAPSIGAGMSALSGLLVSPTGDIWITIFAGNRLARLDQRTRRFVSYPLPTRAGEPAAMTMDAHHHLWFAELDAIGVLHL